MGFPRQRYWSGFPLTSPGDLPDPRVKPMSPVLAGGFFTTEITRAWVQTWCWGTKILQAAQCGQKKKKREREGKREKLISDTTEKLS